MSEHEAVFDNPCFKQYQTPNGSLLAVRTDGGPDSDFLHVKLPSDPRPDKDDGYRKLRLMPVTPQNPGWKIQFWSKNQAIRFLARIGVKYKSAILRPDPYNTGFWQLSLFLVLSQCQKLGDRPHASELAPAFDPALAPPQQQVASRPAAWSPEYRVTPEQDPRTGQWAFHVYHTSVGRLTCRGYSRAGMAERVAEMRWKLELDRPDSASRRYLTSHFNDTLKVLEG